MKLLAPMVRGVFITQSLIALNETMFYDDS